MGASLLVLLFATQVTTTSQSASVQGVLTNAAGLTVEGTYNVAIGLFDAPEGGNVVWPQNGALFNSNIKTTNGVFSITMTDLNTDALAQKDLWLGIQVMGEPELKRVPVQASLRALAADTANDLKCTGCVAHSALAQGDCTDGQILKWQEGNWNCAEDNNNKTLTEADVDKMVANNGYANQTDLKALTDELSPLAKTGQWKQLIDVPKDIADGDNDTQLTEKQVDDMVANNGYLVTENLNPYAKTADLAPYAKTADLAPYAKTADLPEVAKTGNFSALLNRPAGLDDGDNDLLAELKCNDGDVAKKLNGTWTCQPAKPSILSGTNPPSCSDNKIGELFYRTSDKKLMMCDGAKFRVVKLCENKCPDSSTVVCGQPITDDCNESCSNTGTALNSTQCAAAAQDTLCGQPVSDQCANACANKGLKLNINACYPASAVQCGTQITDPCGNACDGTGTNCSQGTLCSGQGCQPVGSTPETALAHCKALLDAGIKVSGTYYIDPDLTGPNAPFKVYCDMTTQGGGWTLIAKLKGNDATMNRKNTAQWRNKVAIGDISTMNDENAIGASYDKVPFNNVMIRSTTNAAKNLGWSHSVTYQSVWHVVEAGKRISDGNKLFGGVSNLDFNGPASYHTECGNLKYGFFTADWTQNESGGIAGHASLNHGHAGGVVGASIFDPDGSNLSHVYCLSDFALGGGYVALKSTQESYSINAHYWSQGNIYTHSWKGHSLFVR